MTEAFYTMIVYLWVMGLADVVGKVFVAGALWLGVNGAVYTPVVRADPPVSEQEVEEDVKPRFDTLTAERVEELMKKGSPDAILQDCYDSGLVQRIEFDRRERKTNFDELVFQRDVPEVERQPVLVLFYTQEMNPRTGEKGLDVAEREAIIFRQLALQYEGKIRFVAFDEANDPRFKREFERGTEERYNVTSLPSIVMYSPWDVVRGETPVEHDGVVTKVDILRGGPASNEKALEAANTIGEWWVAPNLLNRPTPDDDGVLYRFLNTGDYNVVKGYDHKPKKNEQIALSSRNN